MYPLINKAINELESTNRIQLLSTEMLDMAYTTSTEMAELAAKAYLENEGASVIIKRAKSFEKILNEMSIYIRADELIVGNKTPKMGACHIMPQQGHPIDKEVLKTCAIFNVKSDAPIIETYETRFLVKRYGELMSQEAKAAELEGLCGMAPGCQGGFGHIIADYEKVIRHGAIAIAGQASAQKIVFEQKGMTRQKDFCEAVEISFSAFSHWGIRYANLARDTAEKCPIPVRVQELRQIAEICERVPAYPARTFREAMQSLLFIHIAFFIEQYNGSISLSGFDQYLNEYLQRDIQNGILTWTQAAELMDNFFIKLMEITMHPKKNQLFQHLSIGGQDIYGQDTANDLSFLILDSTARMKYSQPSVSVRWHENINPAFWRRACDCTLLGFGIPSLHSDKSVLSILDYWGVPRKDAVKYGIVGCNEPALKGQIHGQTLGAHLNLTKCLELALNDGRAVLSGRQIGPHTGLLVEMISIEEVYHAYQTQIEYAVRLVVESVNCAASVQKEFYGYPFMSGLMDDAIELGRDITYGSKYNFPTTCILGTSNVVDSLMAIEDLAFISQEISKEQIQNTLRHGYQDKDQELRQKLLNHPEKFGRGKKRFSDVYNKVCSIHEIQLEKYIGPRGDFFASGTWPTSWHIEWGKRTAASADGRNAGDYLADGVGPYQGGRKCGPTDVMRNMAAVDSVLYWQGGYTFNMWFTASSMKGEEAHLKYSQLLDAYFEMGGEQIQINAIDKEVLSKAQQDPNEYANLVVRVTGFSAYFVTLSPELQNEIIDRMQYSV